MSSYNILYNLFNVLGILYKKVKRYKFKFYLNKNYYTYYLYFTPPTYQKPNINKYFYFLSTYLGITSKYKNFTYIW